MSQISSGLELFRRLLLQIGGANIAGADRVLEAAYSRSLGDGKHVPPLLLNTVARAIQSQLQAY